MVADSTRTPAPQRSIEKSAAPDAESAVGELDAARSPAEPLMSTRSPKPSFETPPCAITSPHLITLPPPSRWPHCDGSAIISSMFVALMYSGVISSVDASVHTPASSEPSVHASRPNEGSSLFCVP